VEKTKAYSNVIVFSSLTLEEQINIVNQGGTSTKLVEEEAKKIKEEILKEHQAMIVEQEMAPKEHE
jgi:3-oxoacyl-(acyl-carrier-protein) synthase